VRRVRRLLVVRRGARARRRTRAARALTQRPRRPRPRTGASRQEADDETHTPLFDLAGLCRVTEDSNLECGMSAPGGVRQRADLRPRQRRLRARALDGAGDVRCAWPSAERGYVRTYDDPARVIGT
jgi:hypothetical protein